MNSSFEGTGVALVTPFNDDLTVDYDGLKKLLKHVSPFVDYLVVHGTTGESPTTTTEEKKQILDFVIKENVGKLPVVLGVGSNNTIDLVKKIKGMDFKGVDGILSVVPYYNKPSQEGLYLHYKAIAEASPVPVLLYNIPGRTGINMTVSTTTRLAAIKNIVGIKEANADLNQTIDLVKNNSKDFLVISGDDMLTVPFYSVGGKGVISVLANAYPQLFSSMVNSCKAGDYKKAGDLLGQFSSINPKLYEEGNPVGIKQVLELMGICKANVRLPLAKASANLKAKLSEEFSKIKN